MSIKLLDRCWRFSTVKGGDFLVLLAIADFSNDEGIAYPSIATLARKARLTPRNTQRVVRRLIACGELVLRERGGPHGTHLYRITLCDNAKAEWCQTVTVTKCQDGVRDIRGMTSQPYKPSKETVNKMNSLEGDNLTGDIEGKFEQFWNAFPDRNGKKLYKAKAKIMFLKLNQDEQFQCLRATREYAKLCRESNRFPLDPIRFLNGKNGEVWREFIPTPKPPAPTLKPVPMRDPLLDRPLTQEDKDRLKRLLPNIASQFEGMA